MNPFELYPFQEDAVAAHVKALDSCGASLDGTDCGGGKTVIAAAVAARYGLPTAVVCPKSVLEKWEMTMNAFGIAPLFVLNPEKLRGGRTPWLAKTGKKTFRWVLPEGVLLIFDEAHVFGAHNSLNGAMLESALGKRTLMLSATAAESPLKMKAIGAQLRLFRPGSFWPWVRRCGATTNPWGGLEWEPALPANKEILAGLHHSIYTSRGYRVSPEVLDEQLPELRVSDEPLTISTEDRQKIKDLYEAMADPTDPGGVKNLRQRQSVELVKVPYLIERTEEIVESGGSVVVFLNFHESIDRFVARCHVKCEIIDGRQKAEDRLASRDRFQAGELRVIVVQIAAGGQSIDLHDTTGRFPRVALICPQFSGLVEHQAIGRIWRLGVKSRALALRLYVPGTVETGALKVSEEKRENVKILNEGATPAVSPPMPEKTDTAEREHSKHSPSSLREKAKCPGFRNDPTRDTTAADRGTLGHKAVELADLSIIPEDDSYLRAAALSCIKYLAMLRKKCGSTLVELREKEYDVLDQFGHVDHVMIHGAIPTAKIAELIDFKFAWREYTADSPQFWAYAVGLWDAHPEVETINVHVPLPFQQVIDTETWTRTKDYERLSLAVAAVIAAAEKNDPETYQTGEHCTWCAFRAECHKMADLALSIAVKYKPDELKLPDEYNPELITDPERMSLAKKMSPILKSWAEKVDRRALEMRFKEGIEIPGFELAERNAPFTITNPQAAWDVVKDRITPEAFAACADVSIGALEKAIVRTVERGQGAKAKAALRDALIDATAAKVEGTIHYLKATNK